MPSHEPYAETGDYPAHPAEATFRALIERHRAYERRYNLLLRKHDFWRDASVAFLCVGALITAFVWLLGWDVIWPTLATVFAYVVTTKRSAAYWRDWEAHVEGNPFESRAIGER